MIMFGSFLPSLLVGFCTTNFTRAGEPTLSWNQLHLLTPATGVLSEIDSMTMSAPVGRVNFGGAKTNQEARRVGVGIMIAHNPLHGSGQAAFPHPALTLGDDAEASQGIGMTDGRQRQPA